jgi:CubicO group peptidase (beta-lactamase class C family)
MIKTIRTVGAFAAIVSCSSIWAANDLPHDYQALNQSTLNKMRQYKRDYNLPSLSLSIAIKGDLVFEQAVGYADISEKRKATPRTQYSVGSIAKSMTGIALGKLIDAGNIDLNQDIHQYLPDYPALDHRLTIKQLASHTAGIGRPWKARNKREFVEVRDHKSPFESLELFQHDALLFQPGENFTYTSSGYILLSAAIERAANQNYVSYMQQAVWSALDMNNTEHDTSFAGKNEATYYASVNDQGEHIPSATPRDRSYLFGGGGFISTPTDLVKMAQAFYRTDFLSDATKKHILTPVKLSNGAVNEQSYGLGWRMIDIPTLNINGKVPMLAHHGGVTDKAATAFVLLMPEYEAAIAYAINLNAREASAMRADVAEILAEYISQ